MSKRIRASEIVLADRTRRAIGRALAPIEAWKNIDMPEAYLDSRQGFYISGLEELLKYANQENDPQLVRQLLLDLLRMTKIGKAKAEITMTGVNKLRPEHDLTGISTDALAEMLGRAK